MSEPISSSLPLAVSLNRIMLELNSLARSAHPEKNSWKGLRKAILQAAPALLHATEQSTAPISLEGITRLRQIHDPEYFRSAPAPEAVLVPVSSGFKLRLRPNVALVRHRFSVAHEVGHTFFYDLATKPPARLLAWNSSGVLSQKEEDICNAFARELLMPRELMLEEMRAIGGRTTMEQLTQLSDRFVVSEEAVILRLLWDLSQLETVVAVFHERSSTQRPRRDSPRRYWGKAVTNRLRQREKQILAEVNRAVLVGPPFSELSKIAKANSDVVDLEVKVRAPSDEWSIMSLMTFHRDRSSTFP